MASVVVTELPEGRVSEQAVGTMLERYTDQARRVVARAQAEARTANQDRIGTGHILLGLIQETGSLAASVLDALEVSPDSLRRHAEHGPAGGQRVPRSRGLTCTPRARTVLEQSTRWVVQLGDNHIGTEHMLLALSEEREGAAAAVLAQAGVDPSVIRQQVMRRVHTQRREDTG